MSYLKKYEYLIAISKFKSISQSAESFGITQSTFSKYIKKIESELGVELIDRSTIPIKLTKAGEQYVIVGKRFIDLDRQLNKQLEEIKLEGNATIKVGVSPSRSPYIMPEVIESFNNKRPSAKIVIQERTTNELNRLLSEGELDIVISLLDEETAVFDRVELMSESVLLATSKKLNKSNSPIDILKNNTLINVGKGQFMWQIMERVAKKFSLPEPRIECQSIESALALVKRGVGVMLVPSYICNQKNKDIDFFELPECEYNRKVCIFYRKEQFLTKTEKDFIDCVKDIIKED